MRGVRVDPERRETRVLRRHVPFAGARVLDIGCGDGRLSNRIRGLVASIAGVDLAGEGIARAHAHAHAHAYAHARNRLEGIARFAVADASVLPFHDRSFDLALFSWSL